MKPLISIVIPAYNSENYIKRCLDSVFTQTITDYELIIIDDASLDKTKAIITQYILNHSFVYEPIFITNSQNCGCASCRNIGMHLANGKYICFLDADDFYKPVFLEVLSNRMIEEKSDFVFCGYDILNSSKKTYKKYTDRKSYPRSSSRSRLFIRCQIGKTHIGHWAALYNLSFLRKQGIEYFDRCQKAADTEFVFRVLLCASKITCVKRSLYVYNIHSNSITTSKASEKLFDGYYAYQRMLKYIKNPIYRIIYYFWKFPRETYEILNKFYSDKVNLPYLFDANYKILFYCILNIIFNHQKNNKIIIQWFYKEYIKTKL